MNWKQIAETVLGQDAHSSGTHPRVRLALALGYLGCFGGFKVKVSRHSQETGKFRFGLGLSNSPSLAILLNPDLLRRPA